MMHRDGTAYPVTRIVPVGIVDGRLKASQQLDLVGGFGEGPGIAGFVDAAAV